MNYFWDSCVFCAYLGDLRDAYDVDSIEYFIDDAKRGKCSIFTSSVCLAEVRESHVVRADAGSYDDFFDSFQSLVQVIDADPNVMRIAGQMRDIQFKKDNGIRRLGLGDAIMLATCLYMPKAYSVEIDIFHTYDKGKKRGPEGKGVPILDIESWCKDMAGAHLRLIGPVLALKREAPIFSQKNLI